MVKSFGIFFSLHNKCYVRILFLKEQEKRALKSPDLFTLVWQRKKIIFEN